MCRFLQSIVSPLFELVIDLAHSVRRAVIFEPLWNPLLYEKSLVSSQGTFGVDLQLTTLALLRQSDLSLAQLTLISVHLGNHFAQTPEGVVFEVHLVLPEEAANMHPENLVFGVPLMGLLH